MSNNQEYVQGSEKLTRAQALEIRILYSDGNHTQHQLAAMYKISQSAVCALINYKTYKGDKRL